MIHLYLLIETLRRQKKPLEVNPQSTNCLIYKRFRLRNIKMNLDCENDIMEIIK